MNGYIKWGLGCCLIVGVLIGYKLTGFENAMIILLTINLIELVEINQKVK